MELPITGGCLCGKVRYSVSEAPKATRQCWCRTCQAFGSGSATVNLVFSTDAVAMTGVVKAYCSLSDAGNHMVRGFCPHCGVQVTSAAEERPHLVILRAGTLDDPSWVKPEMAIWTAMAPPWAQFDPALPRYEYAPPPPGTK